MPIQVFLLLGFKASISLTQKTSVIGGRGVVLGWPGSYKGSEMKRWGGLG